MGRGGDSEDAAGTARVAGACQQAQLPPPQVFSTYYSLPPVRERSCNHRQMCTLLFTPHSYTGRRTTKSERASEGSPGWARPAPHQTHLVVPRKVGGFTCQSIAGNGMVCAAALMCWWCSCRRSGACGERELQ